MKMSPTGHVYGKRIFKFFVTEKEEGARKIAFHAPYNYIITRNGLILWDNYECLRKNGELLFNFDLREGDLIEVVEPVYN